MFEQLVYNLYLIFHYTCILVANIIAIVLLFTLLPTILYYIIFGGLG